MLRDQNQPISSINELVNQALTQNQPSAWFEQLYSQASGDATQIPWANLQPNPHLMKWMKSYRNKINGQKALVTGCGLGDDAEALTQAEFKVTAFDVSPTAIDWCHQRFPQSQVKYVVADLLNLDSDWVNQFDFILSSRTIQALPVSVRPQVVENLAKLLTSGGTIVILTQMRDTDASPEGPPWPVSRGELFWFQDYGLELQQQLSYDESTHLWVWQKSPLL